MADPAPPPFQVMAKPVGPTCNLACRYCYYLGKAAMWEGAGPTRMSEATLEALVAQVLAAAGDRAAFAWHGGEPTLAGLDFFRAAVALQRRHRRPGQEIVNDLQTNGLSLDEEWCRFLAAERFSVGLSLDGPEDVHDRYRLTRGGEPTQRRVVRALRLLQEHRVHCDVLCVVHDGNVGDPVGLYRYLKSLGARYVQLLPLVERDPAAPGGVGPRTVDPARWGELLRGVFDEWVRQDVGRVVVQTVDEAFRPLVGAGHALCVHRERCGDVVVVEHDGSVFSCDHFVDPAHRLGSLHEVPLGELVASEAQRRFGEAKAALPQACRRCEALAFCNGGCPKDRVLAAGEGEPGRSWLCDGIRAFHAHARPLLAELARLWMAGRPVEGVMRTARERDGGRARVGRNDPCPCGSGRKYKQCCLGR